MSLLHKIREVYIMRARWSPNIQTNLLSKKKLSLHLWKCLSLDPNLRSFGRGSKESLESKPIIAQQITQIIMNLNNQKTLSKSICNKIRVLPAKPTKMN
jgi:hypothetical protein